jgi:hypothetical protein
MSEQKPKKRLTIKQAKLVAALPTAKTQADAAIEAGYSPENASQSAYQALKAIEKGMPETMAELGLTNKVLIEKHLMPLLGAERVGLYGTCADGHVRLGALKLAGEWKGVSGDDPSGRPETRGPSLSLVFANKGAAREFVEAIAARRSADGLIDLDASVDANLG